MKRKTDPAPTERYLSETERDRFRAAFCARTSDAAPESAAPSRTRLTPAELYLRPPVTDYVECPPDLMHAFPRQNTPPSRTAAMATPLPSPRPRPVLPPGWRIIEGGRW